MLYKLISCAPQITKANLRKTLVEFMDVSYVNETKTLGFDQSKFKQALGL